MLFLYEENAGVNTIVLKGDNFLHAIKANRKKIGDTLTLRNYKEKINYIYKITNFDKKSAILTLQNKEILRENKNNKYLHIGWAIIEPSIIRANIPYLAQIGVSKITFIKTNRSQNNFKINIEKFMQINQKSNQQSGRVDFIEFDIAHSIKEFIQKHKDAFILDKKGRHLLKENIDKIDTIIVGPEGGFSDEELSLFDESKILLFNTENTLKSETAAIAAASCILL